MPAYTVALPVSDESLSSWVHRLPTTTPAQYDMVEKFKELQFSHPANLESVDPDFELADVFGHSIIDTFRIKGLDLATFSPEASWIIPHSQSDFACRVCVAESLRRHQRIVLHKQWRYVSAPICSLHREFLTDYGWRRDGNLNFLSAPTLRLREDLTHRAVGVIIDMALPIQAMMLNLERQTRNEHSSNSNNLTDEYQARKTLIEFFLLSDHVQTGLAYQSITESKQSHRSLQTHGFRLLGQIGALEASAPERACALIMMGIVTGYLKNHKIALLNHAVVTKYGIESWGALELGIACNNILGSDIRITLRNIESALDFFKHPNPKLFARGLKE
jgi:hypothetical protein